jgi:hypothetical protein
MTGVDTAESPAVRRGGFFSKPSTKLGWWSVGLAVVFVAFMILNVTVFMRLPEITGWIGSIVLPSVGIVMILNALAAGVTGVIAVVRQHERSWLVWLLPMLVGAYIVFMLVGEFLYPH